LKHFLLSLWPAAVGCDTMAVAQLQYGEDAI
jgi:hypothetical protein